MDTSSLPALTPADLGLVLQIANIIESRYADYPQAEKRALASIIVTLEDLIPVAQGKPLLKWLTDSRNEWLEQSPGESFGLSRTQWQAVRILEQLA